METQQQQELGLSVGCRLYDAAGTCVCTVYAVLLRCGQSAVDSSSFNHIAGCVHHHRVQWSLLHAKDSMYSENPMRIVLCRQQLAPCCSPCNVLATVEDSQGSNHTGRVQGSTGLSPTCRCTQAWSMSVTCRIVEYLVLQKSGRSPAPSCEHGHALFCDGFCTSTSLAKAQCACASVDPSRQRWDNAYDAHAHVLQPA